jgi:hypothetical protein
MQHMRTADAVIESLIRHGIICSMPHTVCRTGFACCIRATNRLLLTWHLARRW